MQKFKIPLLISGGVLIVAVIVFFVFRGANVYSSIPASAVAVIEVNSWKELNDKLGRTVVGVELKKTEALAKMLSEVATLETLLNSDASLKNAVSSGKTVASLHLTSALSYDFLFTTDLPGVNDNTVLNHLQSSALVKKVSVRIFRDQKIIDVLLRDGRQLSFAKQKSVLAMSFTSFLTESSLTAMNSGDNLANDKSFKTVMAKSAIKDISLYFNLQKAPVILPVLIRNEKLSQLRDVSEAGSWAHYDVSFDNEKLELDGAIATGNEHVTTAGDLLNEGLLSKIPAHAALVELGQTDTSKVNATTAGDLRNCLGNTSACVVLEPLREDFSEQSVLLLSISNKAKAVASLTRLAGEATPVDTFLSAEIFSMKDGALLNQFFPNSLVAFNSPVYTVTNNAAIFCNNIDVLKLLLEKVSKGETLDKDNDFQATGFSHFGKNSGLTYINFSRADLLLNGMMRENSSGLALLSGFKDVLVISNANENKTSSRLVFSMGGGAKVGSGLKWKTKLKAGSVFTPAVVTNSNTGEKEVFVQDTLNNVYLISRSGEILFTKNTGEAIVGTVRQLDYYNNGKLQYIFNSAQHVFIIDRLGNDVGAYPLRLSSTASAGAAVVKDGGSYRYFIPCVNGSVYGYEANGKPLSGWSPRGGVGVMSRSAEPVAVNGSNFIVTQNNLGKVSMFDLKGNQKWSVDGVPAGSKIVKQGNSFKLIAAAGNQLTEISADGNDRLKPLIDNAGALAVVASSDTTYNYYFSTGNQVRSYSNSDEFQGATTISGGTISSMEMLGNAKGQMLLLNAEEAQQLFIYDLSLKSGTSFSYTGAIGFVTAPLFSIGEIDVLTIDLLGNVSCYRLK